MNFLIFDNEHVSLNLVNAMLADFQHVTFITPNDSLLPIIPSSTTHLLIKQVETNDAHEVLESLTKHENDPFDAVLLFNPVSHTSFYNILETLKRLKHHFPHLFLVFVDQEYDNNGVISKLLKNYSEVLSWSIIICKEINSSILKTYQIEKTHDSNESQLPITGAGLLEFLYDELQSKKYLNKITHVH